MYKNHPVEITDLTGLYLENNIASTSYKSLNVITEVTPYGELRVYFSVKVRSALKGCYGDLEEALAQYNLR